MGTGHIMRHDHHRALVEIVTSEFRKWSSAPKSSKFQRVEFRSYRSYQCKRLVRNWWNQTPRHRKWGQIGQIWRTERPPTSEWRISPGAFAFAQANHMTAKLRNRLGTRLHKSCGDQYSRYIVTYKPSFLIWIYNFCMLQISELAESASVWFWACRVRFDNNWTRSRTCRIRLTLEPDRSENRSGDNPAVTRSIWNRSGYNAPARSTGRIGYILEPGSDSTGGHYWL